MRRRWLLIILFHMVTALRGEVGTYAGARTCAGCHPKQSKAQALSAHAAALNRTAQHPLFKLFPESRTFYRQPDFRLDWKRGAKQLDLEVSNTSNSVTIPVEWAFGAGQQAITFVSRLDEDNYVEHHVSYYTSSKIVAATPGHRGLTATGLRDASGLLYPTFDPESRIMQCFQCHSTGPLKLGDDLEIVPTELGVRCEACHGPGSAHVKEGAKSTIFNPASMSSASMNQSCGNCHRPPASDSTPIVWTDPWNVRHAPLYLSRSSCFMRSDGKLRCTSCHDPHGALESSSAAYNARCGECHTDDSHRPAQACAGGSCVSCHMPKVQTQPDLMFTNHWIGVFSEGNKLAPRD